MNTLNVPPQAKCVNIITYNRRISEVARDAIEALKKRNNPVRLVEYGGKISRYAEGKIERLSIDAFRGEIDRAAKFWTCGNMIRSEAPPNLVIRDILSSSGLGFPKARGTLRYPILSQDGSIHVEAGYDPSTEWIYDPVPGFALPCIPAKPTRKDMQCALGLIDEMIGQFPFDSPASRAHAIAGMVTLTARPAISGCIPMFAYDAPAVGTGKGLLTRAIVQAVTGEAASVTPACDADSEWAKTITSFLKDGTVALMLDNVNDVVKSAALAALLTGTHWRSRLLGTNEIPEFEINAVVFLAGNNLAFSPDIARRVCLCRLDAKCYRCSDRVERFKHDPLLDWVASKRSEILGAVFVLIRAWFAAGCPAATVRPLATFEPWSRFVGGVLEFAGIEGFLANVEAVQDRGNQESEYYTDIVSDIYRFVGDLELTAKEIVEHEEGIFWERILPKRVHTEGPKIIARELGSLFAKLEGKILTEDGLRVVRVGMRHSAVVWKLIKLQKGESGELRGVGPLRATPRAKA